MWAGFERARSGTVAITFAIVAVPMLMGAAIAVDYGKASADRAGLQSALDTAVLAAMSVPAREKRLGADPIEIARKTFIANYSEPTRSLSFDLRDETMHGSASVIKSTLLSKVFFSEELVIDAKSAARSDPTRHPVCFMALHPSRKHTIELKDSVSVFAPDCNIYGNSDHPDDVVDPHTPQNFLTGKTVQAVGYGHHYLQNVKPPLEYAPEILRDPLRDFVFPLVGGCTATAKVVTGNGRIRLSPGTYCGGLTILNANNVEFEPGTYVVQGGTFKIASSKVSGKGVTIFIQGTNYTLDWESSVVELEAPESGPMAGMGIVGERIPSQASIRQTFVDVYGTIYMPMMDLLWINEGVRKPKAKWTVWITDGISWRGSGTKFINFDIKNTKIPYPRVMLSVIPTVGPGRVRLVR